MEQALWFAILLVLLASTNVKVSSVNADFENCETTVKKWASSSLHSKFKDDTNILKDLLFFLHVPRTGGRTYYRCFLRKLYANSRECPQSYDKLRYDPSKSNCMLLATHDDYNIISKLPQERTSVMTILRNPIDRVFSSYEFSIEVAARFLVHPNKTLGTRMSKRALVNDSTLDIWPWKYLVPWMRNDLFARQDARRKKGPTNDKSYDSYNMEEFSMPLHDYIIDPIALDIIHNGATFQIAGLTNSSYIEEAHEVRKCAVKHPSLGKYVLDIAKKRLDDMLFVGLTEEHKESATMFANVVGGQVNSQLASKSVNPVAVGNKSEQSFSPDDTSPPVMTVEKLMGVYESCITGLRNSQSLHRMDSLKQISPANFTKEARHQVSEEIIKKIATLNSLDMELYKYAQEHFAKQRRILMANSVMQQTLLVNAYNTLSWKAVSFSLSTFLLLSLLLFINIRQRASKFKMRSI